MGWAERHLGVVVRHVLPEQTPFELRHRMMCSYSGEGILAEETADAKALGSVEGVWLLWGRARK